MRATLAEVLDLIPADYADIRVEEIERTQVVYRGRVLEEVVQNFELGGCLRVFRDGNWAFACFNGLEEGIEDLVRTTVDQLSLMNRRDEGLIRLPAADELITVPVEDDPRRISLERKVRLIDGYNQILLKTKQVTDTKAVYADGFVRSYFYSTENRYIEQERVYTGVSLRAIASDGNNVQDYGRSFGKTTGFAKLVGLEPEIEDIARIAVELLSAEKVHAGRYTVVIDPLLAGIFAHEAFGHLSEADGFYQNEQLRELMRVGTHYGVEELAIVDDGTMPGERGSIVFDDEGVPARKNYLLKEGRIAGHLHSRQTAHKLGEEPTGNARAVSYRYAPIVRMTNTYIEPRSASLDELLCGIDHGLYVVGARGGMTELETFTFSSQYAYRIVQGRLTRKMLRDVVLSGNVFETLKNIDAIGNDLKMYGGLGGCGKAGQYPLPTGTGSPHIRIRNVVIGGE